MKKTISIVLTIFVLMMLLSGCGSSEKNIVGQWYNEKGKCLDVRSDGSWKLEDSYGTGTWKYLEDKVTIEFTDFYGDTQESEINEDELGKYIDFGYYGNFYKDSYPSEDKIAEIKAKNAISLNPFDGIKYEVSGISPYCKISINNQGCTDEVQKYVTYKFNKEFYKNGDTANVTATLSTNTGEENYVLSEESSEYKVSGQAEYITSVEQIDMDALKKEITDKTNAMISASVGTDRLFGEDVRYNCLEKTDEWKAYEDQIYTTGDLKIKNVTGKMNSVYFSLLKNQKENQFSDEMPYNIVSFVYCFDFSTDWNVNLRGSGDKVLHIPGKMYVNIVAKNIVKNQDGAIYWNDERCDFNTFISFDGIDNLTSNTIMCNSDNYNISKVEIQ